jgi:tetratricopeptide (TPR) repeat protein
VAAAAGAKYILTGSILRTEPALVLTSGISDAATGEVVATQRVDGAEGEDLFVVVDRLSAEVRKDLSLPEAAMHEPDRAVAEVTTDSQEAYQYYLEGREFMDKLYWTEAIDSFQRAVEADSTFAMAYGALAYAGYIVDAPVAWQKEHSDKAMRFMDGATERERYFILAMDAYIREDFDRSFEELERLIARYPDDKKAHAAMALMQYSGREYEEALVSARKAIDLDPSHKEMLNILVYCYERLGDLDNAIEAVNTYIEVAPDEANPYDTRGDLYAYSGRVDRAIDSYEKALEIKPDFYNSLQKMGHMHLYSGNYEEAEMYYNRIASSTNSEERARGRSSLALIPLHQGKFEASLSVLRDGLAADRMDNAEPSEMMTKHHLLATALGEMGEIEDAIEHMGAAVALASAYGHRRVMIMTSALVSLMLEHGMIKEAEEKLEEMKRGIDERGETGVWQYWVGMGSVERARGNTDEALAHFETAAAQAPEWLFITRYCLARAYLEADGLSEAVERFEYILTRYDRTRPFVPVWDVHAHYLLGLAYERSGWNDRAIGKYEEFLEIYKDADPGIPEVEDARSRISRLKTS